MDVDLFSDLGFRGSKWPELDETPLPTTHVTPSSSSLHVERIWNLELRESGEPAR